MESDKASDDDKKEKKDLKLFDHLEIEPEEEKKSSTSGSGEVIAPQPIVIQPLTD